MLRLRSRRAKQGCSELVTFGSIQPLVVDRHRGLFLWSHVLKGRRGDAALRSPQACGALRFGARPRQSARKNGPIAEMTKIRVAAARKEKFIYNLVYS